jgi:hypothetical protein
LKGKLARIQRVLVAMPKGAVTLLGRAKAAETRLDEVIFAMRGLEPKASDEEIPPTRLPVWSRLSTIIYNQFGTTSEPGQSQLQGAQIVRDELVPLLVTLKAIAREDIPALEKELDAARAPWTPGRLLELQD